MNTRRLILSGVLGLGLALALLAVLRPAEQTARAASASWFAQAGSSGACTQNDPCDLKTAVTLAGSGDTVYVAQGTYTGTGPAVIAVTTGITISGGWDGAPSGPVMCDPNTYHAVLDGENSRRAVYITGTIAPVLDGLTLQRGDATGLGGDPFGFDVGGALYANGTTAWITNCRILSSTAMFGGGAAFYYGNPTLGNSAVMTNTASSGGGGVFLYHSPAMIVGNQVVSNTAPGGGPYNGGGGLYADSSSATVRGNTIRDNWAQLQGGGLFVYQSTLAIHHNTIQGNGVTQYGGGIFAITSAPDLQANIVLQNRSTAAMGGGIQLLGCSPFTMTNNVVAQNSSPGIGPGLLVAGCMGCPTTHSRGNMWHNTFTDNNSPVSLFMIHIGESSGGGATVALTNTIADKPGGVYVDTTGAATLDTTLWAPGVPTTTVAPGGSLVSQGNVYGLPQLTGPTFHLGPGSAAVDQAKSAGITTDMDGDERPIGPEPDIGADEAQLWVFLPLAMRDS